MNDTDMFEFTLQLLNLMIDNFEDYTDKASDAETLKRLDKSREHLRMAYVIASPILYKGGFKK